MFAGPAAGVSRAADKETRQMMADIRMLQEQAQQLQVLIGTLSKAMTEAVEASTRAVNARVDSRLDEQSTATTRAFAGQKSSIDTMTRDVGILREKLDESNVRVGSLTQEVAALRQLVAQMSTARASVDPMFGPPDGAPTAAAITPVGASPKAAWDQAFSDYSAGQYDLAVQGFESYVKTFPGSEMADDAQVYICSSYLNMGDNAKVIEACDLAIRNYPNGDKVPDAYYRKGQAFKNLGRTDDARTAFEFIVKTYPNSEAAYLATTQLASPQLARRP
jgi:tol-pal system protein YbgF